MTKTLYTHVDIEIPRPADQVWAVVTDYATDTVWRKGITEMTPTGPARPKSAPRSAKCSPSVAASTSPIPPSPKSVRT
jgi:hypothetical protein